jgi:hypothetical protein
VRDPAPTERSGFETDGQERWLEMRLLLVTAALIAVVVLATAGQASAAARSDRPAAPAGNVRHAGPASPRTSPGFLPFTGLDVLLMASGCSILLFFGAGLRLVPRGRQ